MRLLSGVLDLTSLENIFDRDFYNNLVGMLDLTCIDMHRAHALEQPLVKKVDNLPKDLQTDFWDVAAEWWIAQEAAQRACGPSEDDDEDDCLSQGRSLLPPFEGIGFSRMVALTNHSCFPNVCYSHEDSCEIFARATRDIYPGQELLMSYIELCPSIADRQKNLLDDYGFSCLCVRCRGECAGEFLHNGRPTGLEGPVRWLEEYAASYGLSVDEVAYDVWSNMPAELLPQSKVESDSEESDA